MEIRKVGWVTPCTFLKDSGGDSSSLTREGPECPDLNFQREHLLMRSLPVGKVCKLI